METFSLGDTIRVELDLREESEGEREVTMVLSQEVTNEMPPGEYRCEGVTVYDVHLNRKTFHPDIRFRVVNIPGDHEGEEARSTPSRCGAWRCCEKCDFGFSRPRP